MKLNLLPTYVSKEKVTRTALIFGILIFLACVGGAVLLYSKAGSDLAESQSGLADLQARAQKAKDTADEADKVIATSTTLLRNTNLAQTMLNHDSAYPDLYDKIRGYIPSFYRVNSMSAVATGPGTSTVTLVGVLDTYQQYADLMLALLRIPGVTAVSRAGFTNNNMYVPAPTPDDQIGKPHKPGEGPIPDDPLKRLEYFQGQGRLTGYANAGGFGSGTPGIRGPMPNASQVTVSIAIISDLQTPDPKGTLAQSGAASQGTGSGPGATNGNLPNNTPPVTVPTTPPAGGSSGTTGGRKGRKGSTTDSGDEG
jgi:hypothetical protein